jgi:hypothetical protein
MLVEIKFPKRMIVQGDIEITDWITSEEFNELLEIFDKTDNQPMVRLTLRAPGIGFHKPHATIELTNWELRPSK